MSSKPRSRGCHREFPNLSDQPSRHSWVFLEGLPRRPPIERGGMTRKRPERRLRHEAIDRLRRDLSAVASADEKERREEFIEGLERVLELSANGGLPSARDAASRHRRRRLPLRGARRPWPGRRGVSRQALPHLARGSCLPATACRPGPGTASAAIRPPRPRSGDHRGWRRRAGAHSVQLLRRRDGRALPRHDPRQPKTLIGHGHLLGSDVLFDGGCCAAGRSGSSAIPRQSTGSSATSSIGPRPAACASARSSARSTAFDPTCRKT